MVRSIRYGILVVLGLCSTGLRADSAPMWYQVSTVEDGSGVMVAYERSGETRVSLSNVRIRRDFDVRDLPFLANPKYLKWYLLRYGAACVIDRRKASSEELSQQTYAGVCDPPAVKPKAGAPTSADRQKKAPVVRTRTAPQPAKPTAVERLLARVWDNWEQLFGIGAVVLLFFGLRWVLAAVRSWRGRRTVNLIIAGVPSAGKSALYKRLVDPDVDEREIEALEKSPASAAARLEKIPSGKLTFVPHLRDIPGSFSGEVIDAFVPKRLDGGKRAKTVLVVVLAPVGLRSGAIDHASADYLDQQEGWSILIKAIAQSKLLRRPSLVVIFMNKCDLYRHGGGHDAVMRFMETEFAPIISGIRKATDESKIPTIATYGSALKRINTDDLLGRISNRLQKQMTEKKR